MGSGRRIAALLLALAVTVTANAAAPLRPWMGGGTPGMALETAGGTKVDIAQWRGRVVLVNFWATWCAPCVEEMPALARLRQRLGPRGFDVVAVNHGEGPDRVARFMERAGFDLPVLLDREKSASRAWGVRALPATFLLDRQGRIQAFAEGELDMGPSLERAIEPLLADERPRSASS